MVRPYLQYQYLDITAWNLLSNSNVAKLLLSSPNFFIKCPEIQGLPLKTVSVLQKCRFQLSLILSCKIFILSIFQLVQSSNQLEKDPHNFLIVQLWRELDHHKSPSNWTNLRSSKKFPLIYLSSFPCRGFGQWVANNP